MPDATPIHGNLRRRHAAGLPFLVLLGLAASNARADGWGGALGFGNDNIYRGISLSANRPAWLADLHYDFGTEWLVGIGATAERLPGRPAAAQITAYVDRRWQLDDDWAAKVGAMHYESPWASQGEHMRYDELNAAIGYRGRWRASIAVSPDYPGAYSGTRLRHGTASWMELTLHQPVLDRLAVDAGLGYAELGPTGLRSYRYASAGIDCGIGEAYLYLARMWTGSLEEHAYPGYGYPTTAQSRARWTISVIWGF